MYGRWFTTFVICFWFAAMSWLVAAKILPALIDGDPPDYQASLRTPGQPPDCWQISWKDRPLGFVASRVQSLPGGRAELRSVVQFEQVPLESMAAELFGPLTAFIRPLVSASEDLQFEMLVATWMRFDAERRLQAFRTTVDLAGHEGFLVVDGQVQRSGKLRMVASLDHGLSRSGARSVQVMRREIDLPADALISDSLTPRPELKNLFVGQTWTLPVYRAFPPNSPVQIVQAKVQRHAIISWDNREEETFLVVYRSDAGSNISVARDTLGKEWIRRDGMVLRREVNFSGLQLRFERLPAYTVDSRTEWLDSDLHERLWDQAEMTAQPTVGSAGNG